LLLCQGYPTLRDLPSFPTRRSSDLVTEVAAPTRRFRRLFVGRPMQTGQLEETLLPKTLALPIFASDPLSSVAYATESALVVLLRSEEHTSELQSLAYLVCRLLLEKK